MDGVNVLGKWQFVFVLNTENSQFLTFKKTKKILSHSGDLEEKCGAGDRPEPDSQGFGKLGHGCRRLCTHPLCW